MISVEAAQQLVLEQAKTLGTEVLALSKTKGRVLATDVLCPIDYPSFSNSAMDGFAVCIDETLQTPYQFKRVGVIAAGENSNIKLKPGECAHIMTGAMIPEGCTSIIAQEDVEQIEIDYIKVLTEIKPGKHIRKKGEGITKNEIALKKYSEIHPGTIGFLASLGIHEVSVFKAPQVSILPSGSELITNMEDFKPGKVFESNGISLQYALQDFHIEATLFPAIKDTQIALRIALQNAFKESDLIILSGGVSVGEFDFVKETLKELGVTELFWKVAQKPGKPLFVGLKENKTIFALPGNPASALVCFYLYLWPYLKKQLGFKNPFLRTTQAILKDDLQLKAGRIQFLRGNVFESNGQRIVKTLDQQGSHFMSSFALSNCLIEVPADREKFSAKDNINIHHLPWSHI